MHYVYILRNYMYRYAYIHTLYVYMHTYMYTIPKGVGHPTPSMGMVPTTRGIRYALSIPPYLGIRIPMMCY